ncbi:MAG: hypothetical protein H6Q03_215 [Acidobacteria bacterium]|jgi:hypothetical protein|nr:hypothetical protein [Acidobacteriota bacterium]
MALEGDLSIFRLPDILQVVAAQQKTGILTVQGESDILAVSFHEGRIVAADALNQSFEEMLGDVLASQGILPPDRFQRLSEEHRTTAGERLADFLIRRGALTREQLLQALRFQTYRLLLEVLRWRQGEFKFYSGEEVAYEEGMEPLSVEEVLYRSMRDLLGEGTVAGVLPHGFVAYERVPSMRPLRVAREAIPPSERDPDAIWISADERTILDHLDGHTPAEQLAHDTSLGEVRTQYALFHLLRAGLVRPAGEREAGDEPPAAVPAAVPAPAVAAAPVRAERGTQAGAEAPGPGRPARGAPERAERAERTEWAVRTEWAGAEPERPGREVEEAPETPADRGALARATAVVSGLAAAAVLVGALLSPALVLMPYPAQKAQREGLSRLERQARLSAIDRAARRFYLLEGRYPASLEDLIARGLLAPRQRYDTAGRGLVFQPTEDSYALVLAGAQEEGGADAPITETVAGDVLLDRTLFAAVQDETGVPLVLLD